MADSEVVANAREIKRYLEAHPNAADSLDGVLRWWLPRQYVEAGQATVREALEYLVDQGAVVKNVKPDGTVIYLSREQWKNVE